MSNRLSEHDIDHIAGLARLDVVADEKAQLLTQLNDILNFVSQLEAADTDGVTPLAHPTEGRPDAYRADQSIPSGLDLDAVLAAAPSHEGHFVRVRAVFEGTHES